MPDTQTGPGHPEPDDNIGNLDDMIDVKTTERDLDVPLTDRDRLEIGEAIASAQNEVEQMQIKKQSLQKECATAISKGQEKVSVLSRQLRYGKKMAKVACRETWDYRTGTVTLIRLDDGTEVRSRPMTAEERQMGMHFHEPGTA